MIRIPITQAGISAVSPTIEVMMFTISCRTKPIPPIVTRGIPNTASCFLEATAIVHAQIANVASENAPIINEVMLVPMASNRIASTQTNVIAGMAISIAAFLIMIGLVSIRIAGKIALARRIRNRSWRKI
jgi:hypothetical protein